MEDDEEWMNKIRKYLPGPWNFEDIDKMIDEMEKYFSEQFRELEKEIPRNLIRERVLPDGRRETEIGPIVYGYSLTIGPDGKPVIREFGNVKKGKKYLGEIKDVREPLVDVVQGSDEIKVIAEIPGVQKEDIELTLYDNLLKISVNTESRKYYKEVELPAGIDKEGANSRYNNGILEVTIPLKHRARNAHRIRVE